MASVQRRFRRLEFQAPAFIVDGNRTVYGEVQNLSNLGMFIRTPGHVTVESSVMVSVYFQGQNSSASITVPATVVRNDESGVGFCSPHINIMSFLQLQNILSCHAKQGNNSLLQEFCRFADFYREKLHSYPTVNVN